MNLDFQPGYQFLNRDGILIEIASIDGEDFEYPLEDTNGDVYTAEGRFYSTLEESDLDLITPVQPPEPRQANNPSSKITVIVSNVSTGETYGSMTLLVPVNFEDLGFSFLPHRS